MRRHGIEPRLDQLRWDLVPVKGHESHEWQTLAPKVKQPYAFKRVDSGPIGMAGCRERVVLAEPT
jgi:putative SOS response-associated peptidase YedK